MTTATTTTLTVRGRVLRADVRPGGPGVATAAAVQRRRCQPGGSELHVYRGGHLDLIAEPHRLAPVIERFLRADAAT
jgi:hypothetical protein